MKRIFSIGICLLFLFCLAVPAFAAELETDSPELASELASIAENSDALYANYGVIPAFEGLLTDEAELLSTEEAAELRERLQAVSDKYDCDVLILTVDSLGGKSPTAYADDYFDYNGYGRNSTADGILFMLSMEDRDWAISTCGRCIRAFTDNGQEYMMGKMKSDLSLNRFASAFDTYVDTCDELLEMYENGTPYDKPQSTLYKIMHVSVPVGILLALAIGFLLAGVPLGNMKAAINNVKWQKNASDYSRQGSMQVRQSFDQFLYTNTTRVKVESSSSSSGGSSTHTSSSGRTHGGSSGKF